MTRKPIATIWLAVAATALTGCGDYDPCDETNSWLGTSGIVIDRDIGICAIPTIAFWEVLEAKDAAGRHRLRFRVEMSDGTQEDVSVAEKTQGTFVAWFYGYSTLFFGHSVPLNRTQQECARYEWDVPPGPFRLDLTWDGIPILSDSWDYTYESVCEQYSMPTGRGYEYDQITFDSVQGLEDFARNPRRFESGVEVTSE